MDSLLNDLFILLDKLFKEGWHGTGADSEEEIFVGWALREKSKEGKAGDKGPSSSLRKDVRLRLKALVLTGLLQRVEGDKNAQ